MKNLKRILSLSLAFALALSVSANAAMFSDTSASGQDTVTAVDMLSGLGVIGGYPDGTFKPKNTITRAEFLKILFVMVNGDGQIELYNSGSSRYPDVTSDKWFSPYVIWADQMGIVGGYPDGTFKPDSPVKVSEAVKMLVTSIGFPAADYVFPYGFIDKGNKLGMFENTSGLQADQNALRGDVAILAYNTLFVDSAPKYKFYNTDTKEDDYETPLAAVFGAVVKSGAVVATSTFAPALGNITKEGQVAFKIGGSNYKVNCAINCDEMIGHSVDVWFIDNKDNKNGELDSDDKLIAVIDNADVVLSTQSKSLMTAGDKIGDVITYADVYTVKDSVPYRLFKSMKDNDDEPISFFLHDTTGKPQSSYDAKNPLNWAKEKYFQYYNCGATASDTNIPDDLWGLWIVNYGVTDKAFAFENMRAYNGEYIPWAHNFDCVYTFVDNDTDRANTWNKIIANYSRTSQITDVNQDSVTIAGINSGASIPTEQLYDTDLSALKDEMYVTVKAKTAIVGNEVKDVYSVKPATVLEGKTLDAQSRYDLTVAGTHYYFVSEWFCAKPSGTIPNFVNFADSVKFDNLQVGKSYDVVMTEQGFIFAMIPSEPQDKNYLLITDVNVTGTGLFSKTATVTGLISDGSTKTFEIDSKDGITGKVDLYGKTFFDGALVSTESCWLAADGASAATENDIGAVGKLVSYSLDGDGQIRAIEEVAAVSSGAQFKYEPADNVMYRRADENSVYELSSRTTASTLFFFYDDQDTPEYTDDEFKVQTADKTSAFKDTSISCMKMNEDDSQQIEAALFTENLVSQGSNVRLVYFTMNSHIDKVTETSVTISLQVFGDGASSWYKSDPIAITKNDSSEEITKKALKGIFDPGYQGAVHEAIDIGWSDDYLDADSIGIKAMIIDKVGYLELNDAGGISKVYLTNYNKLDTNANADPTDPKFVPSKAQMINADIKSGEVIEVKSRAINKFYRGSVEKVKNGYITVDAISSLYGRAYTGGTQYTTVDSQGNVLAIKPYTNEGAPSAMYKIAADCKITKLDRDIAYSAMTCSLITPSEIKANTIDENYIVDYILGYTDSSQTTVEIKQLLVYEDPMENKSVVVLGNKPAAYDPSVGFYRIFSTLNNTSAGNYGTNIVAGEGTVGSPFEIFAAYTADSSLPNVRNISSTLNTANTNGVDPVAGATLTAYSTADFSGTPITKVDPRNDRFATFYCKIVNDTSGLTRYYKVTMGASNALTSIGGIKPVYTTYDVATNPENNPKLGYIILNPGQTKLVKPSDIGCFKTQTSSATVRILSSAASDGSQTVSNGSIMDIRVTNTSGICYYKIYVFDHEPGSFDAKITKLWAGSFVTQTGAGTLADPTKLVYTYIANSAMVENATDEYLAQYPIGSTITATTDAALTFYDTAAFNGTEKTAFDWQNDRYDYVYAKVTSPNGIITKYYAITIGAGTSVYSILNKPIVFSQPAKKITTITDSQAGTLKLAVGETKTITKTDLKTLNTSVNWKGVLTNSTGTEITSQTITAGSVIYVKTTYNNESYFYKITVVAE